MSDELTISEGPAGVFRVGLNRPQKRNALTRGLLDDLATELDRLAMRSDVRVVVLEASGPVFCAGMDLGEMQETAQRPDAISQWERDAERYADVLRGLLGLGCPTVAVLQGPALAGGVGLVLACDIVLAARSASLSLPEPQRGIQASLVTPLLRARAGVGRASYLLLRGEPLAAESAWQWGLIHELVEPQDLATRRDGCIASLLEAAPEALRQTKAWLWEPLKEGLHADLSQAAPRSAAARESPEAREGLQAFLERRPPNWSPRWKNREGE